MNIVISGFIAFVVSVTTASAPAYAGGWQDDALIGGNAMLAGVPAFVGDRDPLYTPLPAPKKTVCGCFSCWEEPLAKPLGIFSCNAPANGEQAQYCGKLSEQTGAIF